MQTREKIKRVGFGLYEADLNTGELWRGGFKIKLPRQPFRVLAALVTHPGEVVTRQDLQRELWGTDTNVDFDQAIAAAINKIREALGDSADSPRYVETLTKRGYRFIAPVTIMSEAHLTVAPSVSRVASIEAAVHDAAAVGSHEEEIDLTPHLVDAHAAKFLAVPRERLREESSETQIVDGYRGEQPQVTGLAAIRRSGMMRWLVVAIGITVVLAVGILLRHSSIPVALSVPVRVDQLTHYTSISPGPPNPESFLTMAVDGDRVITSVMNDGRPRLTSIDVDTGETQPIAVPDEIAMNALADISKDGSRLLLKSGQSAESEQPIWVIPTVGGSGRRLPGVLAHDATWMPNQTSILYASGNDLVELRQNDESSTLYAHLPGRAFHMRWSPDGKLLLFTLFDPVSHRSALWEMNFESHAPKPMPVRGLEQVAACCSTWMPDGKSFVFQLNENLWLLRDLSRTPALTQLTNGPFRSLSPVVSRNEETIYFVGLDSPTGLQQFDSRKKEFRPAPAFLAEANRVDFSLDGRWVAWTDLHERLWRARVDGTDKVRLTSDAIEVFLAHWSPDSKRLALMARYPGSVWQTYLVDASGGKPEALLSEARNSADPGWSSDGSKLVIGREPDLMGKESGVRDLLIVDLATHILQEIPGSEGLFSPRWSPDGKWIAALTLNQNAIMLWDVEQKHWQRLANTSAADPVWNRDSKSILVHAFLAAHQPILRINVPSGLIETVADRNNFHLSQTDNYFFGGATLIGDPLIQPRVGTGNLYSLLLNRPNATRDVGPNHGR